ncbi:helix-turn-helix domain-containing protein [Streptacidiphilus monticola]|uniref:Helix-turn-helix domain-containing protein n=1 Tax=Streptacidiphilus monticola TaxID=2161674 RepID=A0ABW1G4L8_9ACTN
MLQFVGLDATDEQIYRALVDVGAASVGQLTERLHLPEDAVLRSLTSLQRQGLAAPSATVPGQYLAAPPTTALGPLLTQRRHELRQAELEVELLAHAYRRNGTEYPGHELVEIVTGVENLARRFAQVQLGAQHELLALVTEDPVAVPPEQNDAEPLALSRGVAHRVVLTRASLERPGGFSRLATALRQGEQVRIADAVPTKLIVADRSIAMVPLQPLADVAARPAESGALLVRAPGLVEALVALFEQTWRQSTPVHLDELTDRPVPDEADQPDKTDLQILSMLLVGMTDASVAKQLDLGLRTVQRRVKRLLDLAGVTTRMQLGWYAYERGWVAR